MRALLFLCAFLFAPIIHAEDEPAESCAEIVSPSNLYMQPGLSKFPLADREDRRDSVELPGREGNIQRYINKQAHNLSKEAQELAARIGLFLRAGRLYPPLNAGELSDEMLTNLLIETDRSITESPSHLFNVPTSASIDKEIKEEKSRYQSTLAVIRELRLHSSNPDVTDQEMLAKHEANHKNHIAELRASIPPKMFTLIRRVNKDELSTVLRALRRVFTERHPIFGDVRTAADYPQDPKAWAAARKAFREAHLLEDDQPDESMNLEVLRQLLNPPGSLSREEKRELSSLRGDYVRLVRSLPSFEGVVYWGADQSGDVIANLVPGSIFEIKPFYNDVNVFAGTPYYNKAVANLIEKTNWPHLVLYKINSQSGRITEGVLATETFPEVLFLPGTQFRIDSHEFFEGIHYVELTEVPKTIAIQPKEQELKVLLRRQLRTGQRPETIRDISGRNWRVWYDADPQHQRSYSAYAWRTVMSSLGVNSVQAFRFALDSETTIYIEETFAFPHLDSVPKSLSKNWLTPSYFALSSVLLGDRDVSANKISVYDQGGGRWLANNFWDKPVLLDSVTNNPWGTVDSIATDPSWKRYFRSEESVFFLWDNINLLFPTGLQNDSLKRELSKVPKSERAMAETYFSALKNRMDSVEHYIRHNYVYRRTQERGRGGLVPL